MEAHISLSQYKELEAQNAQLKFEIAQLKRLIFGARSERFVPSSAGAAQQLQLDFGLAAKAVGEQAATVKKTIEVKLKKRAKKQAKRGAESPKSGRKVIHIFCPGFFTTG